MSGRSFHMSYSKWFDKYNSHVTFADYRFPDRNYLSMRHSIHAIMVITTVTVKKFSLLPYNKQFPDIGISSYINYSHRNYCDLPANNSYNLSLSRYFNIGCVSNVSINLSAYRYLYNNHIDDVYYSA